MELYMLMLLLYLFIKFNIHFNFLVMLNFIVMLNMFTKLSNLMWWNMDMYFSMNNYNYGLIIMSLMILNIILINLKDFWCKMIIVMMFMLMMMNFSSLNLLLYYFLYEGSLMFIYYLIINWSSSIMKFMASYMLMFYTLLFSLPMLLIILILLDSSYTLTFILLEFNNNNNLSIIMYMYMMMGFLVKIPMFMLHGWLLKAHVEATYYGSMILAAVMLKLGGYGLIRLLLMFKKYYIMKYYLIMLNILGMVLMSIMCMLQIDMKLLIAMSSIVHMGLMISSLLLMNKISFLGSYMMMMAHGYSSSGLFFLVNEIYKKTKTRLMFLNKGLIMISPTLTMFWFLFCVSNSAAPLSLNLFSEIFLLTSLVYYWKKLILFLILYCFFSFMYSIYLYSSNNHGNEEIHNLMFNNGVMISFYSLLLHLIPLHFSFLFLMNY